MWSVSAPMARRAHFQDALAAGRALARADRLRCRQCQHPMAGRPHLQDAHPQGERWRWAITGDIIPNMPSDGFTDTLEEAKRDFAAAWRQWLAKTGRDEKTRRPLFGRPVDLGNESA
jgi:hypothetical protein